MQTIGYTSVQRHKAFRGFVPEHRYTVHSAEGRKAWELHHYAELEALLLKWQLALAILIKSQVFTDGLYDFFAARKFYKGFDQARLSEILLYLENRFGAYLRKDITQSEREILRSVHKAIYEGVVIGGVRIFPEVYYPYMDKLYFDHANWNRVPKGVGIADVLGHKEKYVFANVNSGNTVTQAKESEKGCGCSGSGCGCKESQHTVLDSFENKISGIDLVHVSTTESFEQNLKIPYLWIGYSIKGGISLSQVAAECYCDANQMGVSHCVANPANKGQWCGKSPCSGAACNCGTKLHPELCK